MPAPLNSFKQALAGRRTQIGLWLALADPYCAEIVGHAGFDWLVIDGEHAPNDLRSMLVQLQALATSSSVPVIRIPVGEAWMIKQVLDIGCQTVLVPMVESAEQADMLARAMSYPPRGKRGVGAGLARASGFNTISDYLATADSQTCLVVQVESLAGLAEIEAIAAVDGVDGVFIGPADLAADMGYRGNPGHRDVQERIEAAIAAVKAQGKPSGILTSDPDLVKRYLELGVTFVAVGSDVSLLSKASSSLMRSYSVERKAD